MKARLGSQDLTSFLWWIRAQVMGGRRVVVFKVPYFVVPSNMFIKKLSALIEHTLGVRVHVVYTSL